MGGLNLLNRATAAGLSLTFDGESLIVEGPRSPAALVAELYGAKAEVMAALRDRDASHPDRGDAYEGDLPPGPTLLTGGYGEDPAPFDWASAEPLPWEGLAAQRWGPAVDDPEPGIDVPTDDWRWEVANWPPDMWLAWHRRAGELEPPGADAGAIRAAQRLAHEELLGLPSPGPSAGEDAAAPLGLPGRDRSPRSGTRRRRRHPRRRPMDGAPTRRPSRGSSSWTSPSGRPGPSTAR